MDVLCAVSVPQVLTQVFQSMVSVRRMNDFLNSEELEPYVNQIPEVSGDDDDEAVLIEGGTFAWARCKCVVMT